MEYNKVLYEKKEYNLNAVLSFDLLKEILYIRPKNTKDKDQAIFKKINISNINDS